MVVSVVGFRSVLNAFVDKTLKEVDVPAVPPS